jgi:hypothetical protein
VDKGYLTENGKNKDSSGIDGDSGNFYNGNRRKTEKAGKREIR